MPRGVPIPLLDHFRSPYRNLANCWVVKPVHGDWEGYTSLDRSISLPAYSDTPASVPELTYLCAGGVSPTAITTRLNLSKSGVDISVLAFDREKLLSGYYADAEFEAFVINYEDPSMGRDVVCSGRIGNIETGPAAATIELVPWPSFAEQSFGRLITTHCCVPIWGAGACRNRTIGDGPARDDWSAIGSVVASTSSHELRVAVTSQTISDAALDPAFFERLENGDIEFDPGTGGDNAGAQRSIKAATLHSPGVADLVLHEELPFTPSAGDGVVVIAGCKRDQPSCQGTWGNFLNYQGNPDRVTQAALVNRSDE